MTPSAHPDPGHAAQAMRRPGFFLRFTPEVFGMMAAENAVKS